jgi:hypothetical protein
MDPNTNLAQEEGNVSWDEGVPTMNIITEQCLKLCGEFSYVKVKDRILTFVENNSKIALIQKEWKIAQQLMDDDWAIVAFVSSEEELPTLQGKFITVDYNENYEYFLKIEKILMDQRNEGKNIPLTILHDPKDEEFWVPAKVYHNNKVRFHTTKVRKSYKQFKENSIVVCSGNVDLKIFDGVSLVLKIDESGFVNVKDGKSVGVEEIFTFLTRN